MKNKKKILSAITALTITASTFAGFAIPANAAAETYLNDDLDAYTETGIVAQGKEGQKADLGMFDLALGSRGGGGDGTSVIAIEKESDNAYFKIVSGKYATSERGASIGFDASANIPNFEEIEEGYVLNLSFDAKFTNAASTIQIFGITSNEKNSGGTVVNDPYLSVANNPQIVLNEWLNVSVNVDSNKQGNITITDSNGKLVSAKSFTAVGDSIDKMVFYGAESTVYMDNISVSQVENTYDTLTVNVKDNESVPIADATVTIDRAQMVTDETGTVNVALPTGTYTVAASKIGYEAVTEGGGVTTADVTMTGVANSQELVLAKKVYTPVPAVVTMTGGQKVMTAPISAEKVTSKPFTVSVIDQSDIPITDAEVQWSVMPEGSEVADDNVTIEDGIISVAKGFDGGENHVKNFTVTATATKNEESKFATTTVAISDYLFYEPGVGGSSYGTTNIASDGTSNTYIATPATEGTETITLPEAITFTPGTAQLLSFKTAVNNATGYTFRRSVDFTDSNNNSIFNLGYINLDMGDASTANWSGDDKTSFKTLWGSFSGINTWVDVSVLFKTDVKGTTKVELTIDGKEYDLGATQATNFAKITTMLDDMKSIDRYALFKDIIVEDVDVTGLSISGLKEISTVTDSNAKYDYSVDVMVSVDGETFTWDTTIPGATITPDADDTTKAVLSVPAGATDGQITVTSSVSTAEAPKTASFDVNVEPAVVTSVITGPKTVAYMENAAYEYGITDIKDQFGNDISSFVNPVWSIEGTAVSDGEATFNITAEEASTVVVAKAVYNGDKLESLTTENRDLTVGENTITVKAANGTKVMIWNSLTDMEPLAEAEIAEGGTISEDAIATIDAQTGLMTVLKEGTSTVVATITNGENKYRAEYDVVIGTFYAVADATGDSTVVDISGVVPNDKITGYQVTTATAEGVLVNKTVVNKADVVDNTITADTKGAAKVEVAPVYEGVIGDEFIVPAASYDITVVAGTADRTDVYVNDQMVINNLNQGSDNWSIARNKVDDTEYVAGDVVIAEGSAVFNLRDDKGGTNSAKKIKFVKTPSIVERKTRVYVIGDSLVAKYYGNAPEGSEGLVRTGWGQVLADYLTDDVNVTNLGNSGAWAEAMLNDAFTNVKASAQAGDILVLESGYNDSSHTSMEVMKDAIKTMIRGAEEKGMTVFVVTPNASSHSLNEYKGSVKSTGDVIAAVNESNTNDGTNAILIDLAAKSSDFFASYYGEADTDIPAVALEKLPVYYNNVNDSLHSSYNAANCWAAIVANGILSNDSTADIVDTTYEYTFNDGTTDITVSATQIVNPDSVSE